MRRRVAVKSIAKRFEYFELGKSPKRRKKKKETKKEQEVEEEEKQEAVQRGFAFDAFGATSERNLSTIPRERCNSRNSHGENDRPEPFRPSSPRGTRPREGQS